jgi:hypothetical protein
MSTLYLNEIGALRVALGTPRLAITLDSTGVIFPPGYFGPEGPIGPEGPMGPVGPMGPQGESGPAGTVDVGTTTTGAAGSNASVVNVGTPANAILNFTVPAGATGPQGPQGPIGPPGQQGAAGPSDWNAIPNKPSTFPPSDHTHAQYMLDTGDTMTGRLWVSYNPPTYSEPQIIAHSPNNASPAMIGFYIPTKAYRALYCNTSGQLVATDGASHGTIVGADLKVPAAALAAGTTSGSLTINGTTTSVGPLVINDDDVYIDCDSTTRYLRWRDGGDATRFWIKPSGMGPGGVLQAVVSYGAGAGNLLLHNMVNAVHANILADGSIAEAKLANGVAAANLGYTPLNTAGGTITGNLIVNGISRVLNQFEAQYQCLLGYGYNVYVWDSNLILRQNTASRGIYWQNSAGTNVASIVPSGAHLLFSSGSGFPTASNWRLSANGYNMRIYPGTDGELHVYRENDGRTFQINWT